MKFTDIQKKWAMTGVLLAVLGFNVSMPLYKDGIKSMEFASSKADDAEGGACDTCDLNGPEAAPLSAKNQEVVEDLISSLASKKEVKSSRRITRGDRPSGDDRKSKNDLMEEALNEQFDDEVKDDSKIDGLEYLNKYAEKCEARSSSPSGYTECVSKGIISVLKGKSKFRISQKELVGFMKDSFVPQIGEAMTALRSTAIETGDFSTLEEDSKDTLTPLAKISAVIPKKNESLKSDLTQVEALMIKDTLKKIDQLKKNYMKTGDQRYMNQATWRLQDTQNWATQLYAARQEQESLEQADQYTELLRNTISQLTAQYVGGGATMSQNGNIVIMSNGQTTSNLPNGVILAPTSSGSTVQNGVLVQQSNGVLVQTNNGVVLQSTGTNVMQPTTGIVVQQQGSTVPGTIYLQQAPTNQTVIGVDPMAQRMQLQGRSY